ncbi:MAG TPA: EamA family transporter [Tepidisphaeraceae bacterium]|jgi:drug/metabolite transporter (DMT)-like permease
MRMPASVSPRIGAGFLLLAAALWGSSVVVIKPVLADVPAAWINTLRFVIAVLTLSPFICADKKIWRAGLELSGWLFAGFASQTIALRYTTVNRCAFITAMNVIFVPLIAALFGRRIRPMIWAAAITSLAGCWLLCQDGSGPNVGDLWTLGTAITWAMYILRLESKAGDFPPLPLAIAQLIPVAIFSGVWMAAHPEPVVHFHWPAMLFLGLAATAATTFLQAVGQRVVPAPQAAVIFTLEPVFTAIFAYPILHERLNAIGGAGAVMIILAAFATQIPATRREPVAVAS